MDGVAIGITLVSFCRLVFYDRNAYSFKVWFVRMNCDKVLQDSAIIHDRLDVINEIPLLICCNSVHYFLVSWPWFYYDFDLWFNVFARYDDSPFNKVTTVGFPCKWDPCPEWSAGASPWFLRRAEEFAAERGWFGLVGCCLLTWTELDSLIAGPISTWQCANWFSLQDDGKMAVSESQTKLMSILSFKWPM